MGIFNPIWAGGLDKQGPGRAGGGGAIFTPNFAPIASLYLLRLRYSHTKNNPKRMCNMPKVAPILLPLFHCCENQKFH